MTSPAPSGAPTASVVAAWQLPLAAHHAAIYGYSLIGVRLAEDGQIQLARRLQDVHRTQRDALMSQLAAAGVTPVAAQASYLPATAVTDPSTAQRWAVQLEQACAAGYRYVLGVSASDPAGQAHAKNVRTQAITGLDAAALAAAQWRALLSPDGSTEAFPGT
ncbi:MAG: hypothetical protein JWN95_761 [Frankiales bacterium]|nr:hypothetical protein [Frankiales bacterium]